VRDVAWAPNLGLPKNTVATASQDGTVYIWTEGLDGVWSGLLLKNFGCPVWRVSWAVGTGSVLAVSDASHSVTLWKEQLDGSWAQVSQVQ